MKIFTAIVSLFFVIFLTACNDAGERKSDESKEILISRDLDEIKEDGKLKVLVSYSSTSYFLYKGQPMGFEYELLTRLADHLDLELDLIITKKLDSVFYDLNKGKADLVAHGLTITSERKEKVKFTDYLYLTSQVLVQRKPENWRSMTWAQNQRQLIHDAIELIGDTVSVRSRSSYMQRLENLSDEIGGKIIIDTLPGNLSTEKIIRKVVDGEIEYTVADENLAKVNALYYPILNIEVPVSFSQRIAWAVRKNSPDLLEAINKWIEEEKDEVDYYVIYNRYFKNKRDFRRRIKSEFNSLNTNQISRYDDLIKTYSEDLGWDWRLLASLIYQESRFKPSANSWAGASGLMQIMPATARELEVTNRNDPEQSIKGGTSYLKKLYDDFSEIPDSIERIKFSMAAYNCGYYHVKDAQALASDDQLDEKIWDDNVEKMVLALSYPDTYNKAIVKYGYVRGIEPVTYVEQIFERYDHYIKFIEE